MSLKKLKFAKTTINTPMGDIALRGLQLPDVRMLISAHPVETQMLYTRVSQMADQLKDKTAEELLTMNPAEVDFVGVLGAVIQAAPVMVAHIIALASGEDDAESIEIAERLPLDVQLECLTTIGAMTFVMEGGARNFIAKATQLLRPALDKMQA